MIEICYGQLDWSPSDLCHAAIWDAFTALKAKFPDRFDRPHGSQLTYDEIEQLEEMMRNANV